VDVDAVQERPGDALAVALHLHGGTAALPLQIPKITARTLMRCLFAM
jgi:hypothetical protein